MKRILYPYIHFTDILFMIILLTSLILYYKIKNKSNLIKGLILMTMILMILYFMVRFPVLILFLIIPGLPPI